MTEEQREELVQRHIALSWKILEAKYWYYYRSDPKIQDYEYDAMEKEYEALSGILGLDPTASNMVDFDEKRPACQSVMFKLGAKAIAKPKKNRKKK